LSKLRAALNVYFDKAEVGYMVLGFGFLIIYSLQVLLPPQQDVFVVLEIAAGAIYLIFIVDLLLRLIAAGKNLLTVGGLLTFLKENWLMILATLLPAFRSLRVLRVILVLRGLSPFLRSRANKVGMIIGVALPLVLYTSALAIFEAERYADGANITSFGDAVWWAFASVTTVGYGDKFPVTEDGRFVATFLMVVGIGLFSSLTALLAAWVMGQRSEEVSKTE
jgi:voltage-gated potassium channel